MTIQDGGTRCQSGSVPSRLVLGLFLVLAGALLALDRFGLVDVEPFWQYWPVILIVVGLLKVVQPHGERGGGIALLIVGGFFLVRNTTEIDLDFGDLVPFLLVLLGLSLAGGAIARGRLRGGPANDSSATLDALALLGAVSRTTSSQQFRGGGATAIMGGVELDLREAVIEGGEAVIDTFAWWGGIEILVPEGWAVDVRGTAILGAFEDNTRPPAGGSTQRLVIKGIVIMGGVEVKNHRTGKS